MILRLAHKGTNPYRGIVYTRGLVACMQGLVPWTVQKKGQANNFPSIQTNSNLQDKVRFFNEIEWCTQLWDIHVL